MATTSAAKRKPEPVEKDRPVHKARLGSIHLAVWANDFTTDDGDERTFHTITMERNYRDQNDEWHKTSQLRSNDLGDAIALLQGAQQFLTKVD